MYQRNKTVPSDDDGFKQYLLQELDKVEREGPSSRKVISLDISYAAPAKYGEGDTVLADGTRWNPGSGKGVYTYYSGAWNKLG